MTHTTCHGTCELHPVVPCAKPRVCACISQDTAGTSVRSITSKDPGAFIPPFSTPPHPRYPVELVRINDAAEGCNHVVIALRKSEMRRSWILHLKSRLRSEKYLEALRRLYLQRLGDSRLDFLWEEQQERRAAVTKEQSRVFSKSAYVGVWGRGGGVVCFWWPAFIRGGLLRAVVGRGYKYGALPASLTGPAPSCLIALCVCVPGQPPDRLRHSMSL
jgi:hypothetical protein